MRKTCFGIAILVSNQDFKGFYTEILIPIAIHQNFRCLQTYHIQFEREIKSYNIYCPPKGFRFPFHSTSID
jgi:hypothetical protein